PAPRGADVAAAAGDAGQAPGIVAVLRPLAPTNATGASGADAAASPASSASSAPAAAPTAPPALLSSEGRVPSGAQWRQVEPAGAPGLARVTLEDGLTGVVDGAGQWRLPPEFQQIDAFDEQLALARLPRENGASRAIVVSSAGGRFDVPTRVLEQAV